MEFVVLDIGGTKIRGAVWRDGVLQHMQSIATPKVSADEFLSHLKDLIANISSGADFSKVGIASAGPVDFRKGRLLNPVNLGNGDKSWRCFKLAEQLEQDLGKPVALDNDAALTALGYYQFIAKAQVPDLVMMTLGTGLGVGAIVSGQLVRSGQSMHPELGHFIIADEPFENFHTPFNNYPTLESYLSGYHFSKQVGQAIGREMSGNELIQLSKGQSPQMKKHWEKYSQRMAIAWANMCLAYFPQQIVLAGGFSAAAQEFYLPEAKAFFSRLMQERVAAGQKLPEIVLTAQSDELPLLGAVAMLQQTDS